MNSDAKDVALCPKCGGDIPVGNEVCPACRAADRADWEKERDRLKRLWVMAAVFFWFSTVFQLTLLILDGTLNMILLSVIGAMMFLGITLKFRFQRHLRKAATS